MKQSRINILIGILTGILVGFVLGTVFGSPSGKIETSGNLGAGDVSKLVNYRKHMAAPEVDPSINVQPSDTVQVTAQGTDGETYYITIIKNQ